MADTPVRSERANNIKPGKPDSFFQPDEIEPKTPVTTTSVEPTTTTTFPAPERSKEQIAAMQASGFDWPTRTSRAQGLPAGTDSFLNDIGKEVQDFGLSSNLIDVVSDAMQLDAQDADSFQVMQKSILGLVKKHNLPDSYVDSIFDTAKNPKHAEELIKRINRRVTRAKGREQMGIARTFGVGIVGFVADPTNLIPGALLLKGGAVGMKFSAAQALRQTLAKTAGRDLATKTVAVSAFSAAEEAFRSLPRLQADTTFGYEEYVTQVGFGALFGAGIIGAIPVGKFIANKTSVAVNRAVTETARAASENATLRTGANIVETAVNASKDAVKNAKTAKDYVNKFDPNAVVRAARDKANEQVANSKIINSVKDTTKRVDDVIADATKAKKELGETLSEGVVAFSEGIKDALANLIPEGKFKDILSDTKERIDIIVDNRGVKAQADNTAESSKKEFADIENKLFAEIEVFMARANKDAEANNLNPLALLDEFKVFLKTATDSKITVDQILDSVSIKRNIRQSGNVQNVPGSLLADVGTTIKSANDVPLDELNRRLAEAQAARSAAQKLPSGLAKAQALGKANFEFNSVMAEITGDSVPRPRKADSNDASGLLNKLIGLVEKRLEELKTKQTKKETQTTKPSGNGPKSGGAAARKETLDTVTGDAQQDLKDAAKIDAESITKAMQEISDIELQALNALLDIPASGSRKNARQAIRAAANSARNTIEARAAREGFESPRVTLKPEEVLVATAKALDSALIDVTGKELKSLLKRLNLQGNLLTSRILNNVSETMSAKGIPAGIDDTAALMKWISEDPKTATAKANNVRDSITEAYNKARQNLEDTYNGNPADKDFLRAKVLLADQQTKLENTTDWVGMLNAYPKGDLAVVDPKWALLSAEYEESMGAAGRKVLKEQYAALTQRFISNQFGKLTESQAAGLVRSEVPLAEWIALNLLELPAGTGGKIGRNETAAILAKIMEDKIQVPLNKAWFDMMDEASEDLGFGIIRREFMRSGNANTSDDIKAISRQVMLEMNRRQQGVSIFDSPAPPYIKRFADRLEDANNAAYDLQLKNNVDGITGQNKMQGYMRQVWNDGALIEMIQNPNIGKAGIIELIAKSLKKRAGNDLTQEAAEDLAGAVVATKVQSLSKPQYDAFKMRSENNANAMASIEDIVNQLNNSGKSRSIKAILSYTNESSGGGPGYVNKRFLNLDYDVTISKDGVELSILDLLDSDVIANANRYNKEAAGRSAMSRASGGRIKSEQDMDDLIGALAVQNLELGGNVDIKGVRNVFRQLVGLPVDGALNQDVRKIRDAVSLAGMSGLGESQMAETGLALNRGLAGLFGANQVLQKGIGKAKQFMGMQLTDEQKTSTSFLQDLQEFTGMYDNMHALARNNVHFDVRENQNAQSIFSKVVDTATGGKFRPTLQYLQSKLTLYSAVRTMQEQLAMAGIMQDAIKSVMKGGAFTSDARFADVGLDLNLIKRKLDDRTIVLDTDGKVVQLNLEKWSENDRYNLGVALRRHSAQQVQVGFAGESSVLMMNPMIAMLMQFKSYPLLAAEKQMGRNAMFGDSEAAMGIVLNAASSAGARYIRYLSLASALPSEDRERYINQRLNRDWGHDTLAYMGIVGSMVNSYDMVRDIGMGDSSVASQIPALNWADNYLKAIKTAGNVTELSERDVGIMQRGAPLGTIARVNILSGFLRSMMQTDADQDFVKQPNNRGN